MGEKRILTEEMIDEKLRALSRSEVTYIDPMKMQAWTLERACAMIDNSLTPKTIARAISAGDLSGYKIGKTLVVTPQDFLTWFKRSKR